MAKFADVLTIVNGRNQRQVENPKGKYPIYGSGGIMGYANDYICEADTVVIGRKGSINNPIFVETPFWNVDTAFGLCANRLKLVPKYLYYFCEKYDFERLNTTVTIPSLTKANLLKVEIPLPTLDEQRRIAAVLDKVSGLIAKRREQLDKLDELVKSRFVEMFGDNYTNPRNLPILKWDDVFITKTGKLDSNAAVVDGKYPFFTCAKEVLSIDTYAFDQEALLLAGNNAAGKYDVKYYEGRFNAYQRTYVLSLKGNWSYKLFKFQLEEKLDYLQQQSLGGLTKYLTLKILGELSFLLPPMEDQKIFDEFAAQIDKTKLTIQQSLDKLEVLKKALMQQYFG